MDIELDKFKSSINIAEYASTQGYAVDKKKSGQRQMVMFNDNNDTIIIKRPENTTHYMYFNPNDSRDRGSIIDFVQNRKNINLGEVRKELRSYLNSPPPTISTIGIKKSNFNKSDIIGEFHNLSPLENKEYLKSRGLTDTTLNADNFKSVIFNQKVTDKTGRVHTNTVFPVYNNEELVGLELKNKGFAGSFTGSNIGHGVWVSQWDNTKPVQNIYVGENPIDSMSHFQLTKNKNNDIYVATNGPLTNNQSRLINDLIQNTNPKAIKLSFDNDPAGHRFTVKALNEIEVSDSHKFSNNYNTKYPALANADIRASNVDRYTGSVEFLIAAKNKEESIYNVTQLKNTFEKFNNDNFNKTVEGSPFNVRVKEISDEFSKVSVNFKNLKENWSMATEFVHDIKRNDLVEKVFAKNKDWNEDLKESLGLIKDKALNQNTASNNKVNIDTPKFSISGKFKL